MQWERLFDDLEGQLASEWEAERAALAAESERLRISRLDLRSRLRLLCGAEALVTVDLIRGRREPVRLAALGADWIGAASSPAEGTRAARSMLVIPLSALRGLGIDHGLLLSSLEEQAEQQPNLRERMTLGFLLRDLARRRLPVRVQTVEGEDLHGTIDRAGADHLDLALHDAGSARLASAVQGFRIIPFEAIACVRTAAGADQPL
ncbi:hypothetical protein ACI3KS_06355 [Microbacterium sp. ZW T5_45]|uniref:hypothetical protein n=1 Tax=Microbacterium sp. ZW T5_45 TaxID=3378080 RepID=UPI00385217C3